jgi:hypothetical protein
VKVVEAMAGYIITGLTYAVVRICIEVGRNNSPELRRLKQFKIAVVQIPHKVF